MPIANQLRLLAHDQGIAGVRNFVQTQVSWVPDTIPNNIWYSIYLAVL